MKVAITLTSIVFCVAGIFLAYCTAVELVIAWYSGSSTPIRGRLVFAVCELLLILLSVLFVAWNCFMTGRQ